MSLDYLFNVNDYRRRRLVRLPPVVALCTSGDGGVSHSVTPATPPLCLNNLDRKQDILFFTVFDFFDGRMFLLKGGGKIFLG